MPQVTIIGSDSGLVLNRQEAISWINEDKQNNDDTTSLTLTHWGLMMPNGGIDLGQHWLR